MTETARLSLIHHGDNQVFSDAEVVLSDGKRARLPITGATLTVVANQPGRCTVELFSKHVEIVAEKDRVPVIPDPPKMSAEEKEAEPFEDRVGPYAPCDRCGTTWRMRCGRLGCV